MDLFFDAVAEAVRLILTGDAYVTGILGLSLRVSGLAVLLGALVGVPVGTAVALSRFPGHGFVVALIQTGFALPPVVVGLFVYMVLSRNGPLGGLGLLFTPSAMVAAQVVIAAPYIAGITLAAVRAVPPDARLQARALGAGRWRALATHLREARYGLGVAIVAGFGSIFSEVGAVMLVGGNILGDTRVLTTAIVLETRQGDFAIALALGAIVLAIAFLVNVLLMRLQQGYPHGRGFIAAERPSA